MPGVPVVQQANTEACPQRVNNARQPRCAPLRPSEQPLFPCSQDLASSLIPVARFANF